MRKLSKIGLVVFVTLFFGANFLNISTAEVLTEDSNNISDSDTNVTRTNVETRGKVFSHTTRAHKEGKYKDCNFCHVLPTKNWVSPRRDGQAPFPDIRNYPYKGHTVCNTCHIRDVFSDGGIFCGSCHTVPSMRARAVLPFPNKAHSTQFTTIFPHDVHQDIIARNENPPERDYATAHFIPAVFGMRDDKPKPTFYNCAICHKSTTQMPKYEMRKPFGVQLMQAPFAGTDATANLFTKENPLTASYFKTSPDGHESCFTCHYQFKNLPQGKQDCSGCHALTKPYFDKDVTRRYSLRFNHERDGHTGDCTSCHIRITQSDDIRKKNDEGMPIVADVPLVTCKKCHQTGEDVAFKKIISEEIKSREATVAGKQPVFQCTYCHTAPVSKYDVPASHRNP